LRQKILVFEFITGGGFSQQELPESLAKEGLIMLKALIYELASLSNIELTVVLDWRIEAFKLPINSQFITVSSTQNIYDLLPDLIEGSDFFWPIAPEMDGALQKITQLAEQKSKQLLNSSSQAIAVCSDKLKTIQCLKNQGINTVEGIQLDKFRRQFSLPWVIKSKDGVGCLNSYFISSQQAFIHINSQIESKSDYLIQPYIKGDSLSLSCLFRQGKAWLLCCNRQLISIVNGKFELQSCIVNIVTENHIIYQGLLNQIANAIPGLYGYVGIDIIQPEQCPALVLEINPRLTTSYAGINQATGFNVAKAIVEMSDIVPIIENRCDKQMTVSLIS
jgi:predicted ATP-grasp superfamily ATP-dependent carboligase